MRSMTGYGRGECLKYDRKFIVEIKSVNHRYNDMSIKIPRVLAAYEDSVKKTLSREIFRGKTDVYINFETYSKDDIKISFNEVIADNYMEVLQEIKERYNLPEHISLSLPAKFPDLISIEKTPDSEGSEEKIKEALLEATQIALNNFVKMRGIEGEALKNNILEKLVYIKDIVKKVEKKAPVVSENYKERLINKLNELKEANFDEARIITEVTIFGEKACIDEEITRLFSHLDQMNEIIKEKNPIGRKLDFLVQEMNREVNTIGSKSNDLEITNYTVELKSEIEKIREQVQNIE